MSNAKTIKFDARGRIRAAIFLEDGKYVLTGGYEGVIRQWRLNDGVEVGDGMKAPGNGITGMCLSGDGKWIVSSGERIANVWSMRSRQIVVTVSEHSAWIDTVHVSPDSTRFATGSNDKSAFIWDILTGQRLIGPLEHEDRVGAVRFSPDGKRIATGTASNGLRIYNSYSGELLRTIPVSIASYLAPITWPSDQSIFAIVSQTTLMHIDANNGQTSSSWTIPGEPVNLFGPIAWGSVIPSHNNKFIVSFLGRSVLFWDTSTSARISSDVRCSANIWSIALSLDNRYLAIGDADSEVTLHNIADIISEYYLVDQSDVRQPQICSEQDLQTQIEVLRGSLRQLEQRFGGTQQPNDPARFEQVAPQTESGSARTGLSEIFSRVEELPSRSPDICDGTYRIKSKASGLYLTCSKDSPVNAVVMQQSDESSAFQKWAVSLVVDGAYHIVCRVNNYDLLLNVGNANSLVCVAESTTHAAWTIEPRGDAFVMGYSENAMAIHLRKRHQGVGVSVRNNSQNQRWVLERVTN